MTHLADTSVFSRLAATPVRAAISRRMTGLGVARSTLTDLEIGFSARNGAEWDALLRALRVFTAVDVEADDVHRAAGVQRALATLGLRGRKAFDLLIAAAAERRGLTVLHYDRDFELIAEVTGQPHEWVVPRGTIE